MEDLDYKLKGSLNTQISKLESHFPSIKFKEYQYEPLEMSKTQKMIMNMTCNSYLS